MSKTAAAVFKEMAPAINADMVKQIKCIYQWDISSNGTVQTWTVDLKNGDGEVYEGKAKKKATCTLILSEEDFLGLVDGSLDTMKAFMGGKLKIKGNIMKAQKLKVLTDALQPPKSKL
eukprot:m.256772 g.256772  ORF g.256772 m.256772 type:complete len:118 (-) comp34676_c0_seq1:69-422(-)